MSQINVDNIKNRLGSGAPSFPNGIDVSAGVTTFTNGLNVGTGASLFSPASNVLTLGTNSAERVRVDSSGNVGIGTDNPAVNLEVRNTSPTFRVTGNSATNPTITLSSATITSWSQTVSGTDSSFSISRAGTERLRITSTGDVGIGTDNPGVTVHAEDAQAELQLKSTSGTNSAGLRFVPGGQTNALYIYADGSRNINFDNHSTSLISVRSSGGITFNGDTAAENALDDYEEGTFTPTINPGYTVNYDTQSGRYIKVGKLVTVWINIDTNTISGSSSYTYASVHGLPFTIRSSGTIDTAFTVGWEYNLSNSVDHAYGENNQDYIVLLGPNSSGSRTHWSPAQVWNNNDTRIALTGSYWTDS